MAGPDVLAVWPALVNVHSLKAFLHAWPGFCTVDMNYLLLALHGIALEYTRGYQEVSVADGMHLGSAVIDDQRVALQTCPQPLQEIFAEIVVVLLLGDRGFGQRGTLIEIGRLE